MSVAVRTAVPGDVPSIAALERQHLGPDPWSEALIAAGVHGEVPTVHYLVAEDQDVVVAHAVISAVDDVAELQRIAVQTSHRRLGVASGLLAATGSVARAAGARRLLLEVREGNGAAMAFYASRGFAELHRRPRYYRDGTTAVVLGLDLGTSAL